MMSSGKARPEKAELERRVKRRPHRLQRNPWPPSSGGPSFVTRTAFQRRHAINTPACCQAIRPIPLQENRAEQGSTAFRIVRAVPYRVREISRQSRAPLSDLTRLFTVLSIGQGSSKLHVGPA